MHQPKTYRRARVDCDAHATEMLVKAELEGYVLLTRPYDQIVRAGFHIVHDLERVRFDLIGIGHIPHEEALREDQD